MIKSLLTFLCLTAAISAGAMENNVNNINSKNTNLINFNKKELSNFDLNLICNKIYLIEGGANTKYPYGIRSLKTSNPRQVCLNTINNNFARWNKTNKKIDFLTFLANVYCPRSCDARGNINWIKNIHIMIKSN